MKKSTIWILGVVMGLSFISLLYLQISYIEEMVKMRNEQFDESVKRALMAASKDVESAEVDRWLREDISEAEKKAWEQSSQGKGVVQTQRFTVTSPDGTRYSAIELKTFTNEASELPRAMISRKHGTKTIPQTSRSLADAIKNRYLYQRALLDEVAWQMIYRASSRPIEERVNFKNLDQYLKSGLIDNGIELNYHFKVIDRDGREVYRCSDYSDEGSESSYSQPLFLNDPPARMSIVKIHFPGKRDYIFDSVSFMIPSMIFTFVLLITFIFTIYIVFRQKKLTEMKNDFINLTEENVSDEHLCCIIRSRKPHSGISAKREWLSDRLKEGHVFRKLNVKGTVFIEYAPLETAWVPIEGSRYYYIYCLWATGEYKGKGYGKQLLEYCIADAKANGKSGICVLGAKKQKAWLTDQSFLKRYGFQVVDTTESGYELLALSFDGTFPQLCEADEKRENYKSGPYCFL